MLTHAKRVAPRGIAVALADYGRLLRDRRVRRIEVQARNEDAHLLRAVAAALTDPDRAVEVRAMLRSRFWPQPMRGRTN